MKTTTGLLVTFSLLTIANQSSHASLGRKVKPETLPNGICRLTLKNEKTNDSFHCTGSYVGAKLIKTAAHCLHNSKVIKVKCVGEKEPINIEKVEPFPRYIHREILMDESNRWQDHALITTKKPLTIMPFTLVTKNENSQEVLLKSKRCLIAGFGLQEQTQYGTGFLSGTLYSSQRVEKSGPILLSKGRFSYELLPGDSGGPLLCYFENTWFDLGTASAHDWDHNSIYAPNEEVSSWYESYPINKSKLHHGSLPQERPTVSPHLKVGFTYYLRPYSSFVEVTSGKRYYNGDSTHTVFTITEADNKNGKAIGTVMANGASQFYLCEPDYLCFADSIGAEVQLSDIVGTLPFQFPKPFEPFL